MTKVRIKNAKRRFTANRDESGVPHITASNWMDGLYGLGYLQAIDRGTQIFFSRAVASGTAAGEISDKPELLETDQFFRRIGLDNDLATEVQRLEDRTFQQLTAYCEGVNDGLASLGRSLPMWATGFRPQPWNQESVLLIGNLLSFGGLAVSQMQNERLLLELIHAGVGEEALREMFAPRLDSADFELLRQVQIANNLSDEALELLTDLPRLAGSNAWAVSPNRSASGHALLAGDPHLEVNRLPAIWYEAVVQFGDQYVMGATLPGCPLFAVARTNDLAWSVTYMKGDTVDYFVEDCRKSQAGHWQYRRGSKWYDFQVREESIDRKGSEPLLMHFHENDQGVITTDLDEQGEGHHLSVDWTGKAPGSGKAIGTWLDVIASDKAKQAMDVVRDCPQPTLCWVFADRAGHIGLQGCGRFPRRGKGNSGLVPVAAWDKKNHWQGWLSTDLLPRIYDPPEGYIATANEEVNPPGTLLLVTQPVPAYRKRRIAELLAELPSATLDDMKSIQYDVLSLQARDLLPLLLPHLEDGDIKQRLSEWDYCYDVDSCEATLFQRLYRNVLIEIFGTEQIVGWRRMLYLCSRSGFSVMVITAADRLIKKEHSAWWRGRDKGELIRNAAERLEGETEARWSEVNTFHFTDRFFGNHRVGHALGFRSPRCAMPGCYATPFQGHVLQTAKRESTFAPSYHFVTDLGEDAIQTNLPGGPSESRFSRYYKVDVERWFAGEYKVVEPE